MNGHRALLGTLAMLALTLAPACRNTAEGVKQDAEKAKEESREVKQESKDVAEKVADQAKETGEKIGEGAKDVGQAIKEGAKEVASEVDAKKQTVDVKAALMADSSIDASNINVDTDASAKTVTLKGSVPSRNQRAAADRIAREKAEGYTIVNQLTVTAKQSGPPSD
jgi:osmotically-inducible protein OsmY